MPKLKHDDSSNKHVVEATDEQVPMYASQGWREAPANTPVKRAARTRKKTPPPAKGAAK